MKSWFELVFGGACCDLSVVASVDCFGYDVLF